LERFHRDPQAGLRIRQDLGWADSGPPVVGFLGRFVPEKGLALLTKILDRLTTPWRALLVGSGPLTQQLQSWSHRYVDRARVVTGVKHDQVPAYLNAMDVLCAPSQTTPRWREQLGRMLLEAFACGVAVIASDSGEIPFVVRDAGRIVGEQDEEGWVRTLAELLENPTYRAELSARGLERARTVYAWPIIARRHLDFFDELLQG
jgi:glycosyltransferase involved in cell wall biosynthesis